MSKYTTRVVLERGDIVEAVDIEGKRLVLEIINVGDKLKVLAVNLPMVEGIALAPDCQPEVSLNIARWNWSPSVASRGGK